MKKFAITLLASAGVLAAGGAFAADTFIRAEENGVTNLPIVQVRMVCDEYGRCYRARGSRRVVIQQGSTTATPMRRANAIMTGVDITMTARALAWASVA